MVTAEPSPAVHPTKAIAPGTAMARAESELSKQTALLVGLVDTVVQESGDPIGLSAEQWVPEFLDASSAQCPAPAIRMTTRTRRAS